MAFKKLNMVLIKPTGSHCNLRCEYCFYLEKSKLYEGESVTHIMNEATLKNLTTQMFQYSDNPLFAWQGGEPTLAGLDFFKNVVDIQKKLCNGKGFQNAFQTNGILLNENWGKFFKQNNILVGISLDGPEHIHNKYRRDVGDKPTWEKVEKNVKLMLGLGVDVNVLSTINSYSVQYPEELYRYFKTIGINFMQFIPIVETDKNSPEKAAPFSVDPIEYGKFLCKIFDLWYDDIVQEELRQTTSIRFIDSVFHRYLNMEIPDCILQKECGNYLVVEHNGDCYSCDFLVSSETKVGNLNRNDMFEMINSQKQIAFGRQKNRLKDKCFKCDWFGLCYGGCIKDRIRDKSDNNHNRFCESYKMFFSYAHDRYLYLAKSLLKNSNR